MLLELGFIKQADEATKYIKSRHKDPKKSNVKDPLHKNKVIANVWGANRNQPGLDPKALSAAIKGNQVTALADTARYADKSIKSIKHTIAFPQGGKIVTPQTTRTWDTTIVSGKKVKRTGATEKEVRKSHNRSLK